MIDTSAMDKLAAESVKEVQRYKERAEMLQKKLERYEDVIAAVRLYVRDPSYINQRVIEDRLADLDGCRTFIRAPKK